MLIEIYNENGELILDNESKVLTSYASYGLTTPYRIYTANPSVPMGVWAADYQIPGYLANGGGYTEWVPQPMITTPQGFDPVFVESELAWIKPLNNSAVLISKALWGVSVTNGYWDVRGSGFDMKFTKQLVPNDVSGYIDCYNEKGELTWSLNALMKTPQIMGVYDCRSVRSINLNSFPSYMKEKLYFTTTDLGAYIIGDGFSEIRALQVRRVGDMIYFGDVSGNTLDLYALVAYIP